MEFAEHRERMDRGIGEQFFHLQERISIVQKMQTEENLLLSPSVHIVSSMELTLIRTDCKRYGSELLDNNYSTSMLSTRVWLKSAPVIARGLTAV